MAYRLFLGEFKYIEKYLRKLRNDNDSLNDMYHSINLTAKKGKDTNYKIEEVDFITSGLSNEKEFARNPLPCCDARFGVAVREGRGPVGVRVRWPFGGGPVVCCHRAARGVDFWQKGGAS